MLTQQELKLYTFICGRKIDSWTLAICWLVSLGVGGVRDVPLGSDSWGAFNKAEQNPALLEALVIIETYPEQRQQDFFFCLSLFLLTH